MTSPKHRYSEPDTVDPHIDAPALARVVQTRRAVRRFTPEPIPEAVLERCLDLALLAPNSSNLQPWEFYVVRSEPLRTQLAFACMNQNAARTAPVLIVVVGRTQSWRVHAAEILAQWPEAPKIVKDYYGGKVQIFYEQGPLGLYGAVKKLWYAWLGRKRAVPRTPTSWADMRLWAAKTCALAAENLMLALRSEGYDSCPMEGFDETKVCKLIGYARDGFTVMVIACGRRAADGIYQPRLRLARERFVFWR